MKVLLNEDHLQAVPWLDIPVRNIIIVFWLISPLERQ
jgi:hypothetical protein